MKTTKSFCGRCRGFRFIHETLRPLRSRFHSLSVRRGTGFTVALLAVLLMDSAAIAQACLTVSGTVTISGNLTTNCVTVTSTGCIVIKAGGKLTLTGGPLSNSNVDGSIILEGSGSELAFTTFPQTVSGSGAIKGNHDAARISIASGITLTSSTNITGNLEISGAGSFTNEGVVEANNADGTLKLAVAGTLDDSSTTADRWIVSANGAKLHFDAAIGTLNALDGNFVMTSGNASSQIIFDRELTTDGRLEMALGVLKVNQDVTIGDDFSQFMHLTGGVIEVAAGKEFVHS